MTDVILVAGLSVTGEKYTGPIKGIFILAGVNSDREPSLLALNNDGSLAGSGGGGGGSLPSGGTVSQFLRGDGNWSNELSGDLYISAIENDGTLGRLFFKNDDDNHGMTTLAPITTSGIISTGQGPQLGIVALSGVQTVSALHVQATGYGEPTVPVINIDASKKSGTTRGALAAGDMAAAVENNGTILLSIFGNGNATFLGAITATKFNMVTRPDYTITNPSALRSIDLDAYTMDELARVVGTLLTDLITVGLIQ